VGSLPPTASTVGVAYKIVADPYYKHITIEKYTDGAFIQTSYDSQLLDFRSLMGELPSSWERRYTADRTAAVVRDICDRVLWLEKFHNDGEHCHRCQVYSSHGLLLSTHRLFYTDLGALCNGVILYDAGGIAVFSKRYALDSKTGMFTDLQEENWEVSGDLCWDKDREDA
jgi:hypothetical protein